MSKDEKPIILSKDNIRSTYVTLDTIYTPLVSIMRNDKQIYTKAYRVANIQVNIYDLKRDYATEQFIYRITGMCCDVYDSMLARACLCLSNNVCCHAGTERKRNFIILPDSEVLPSKLYWITVFELVYGLKYPQSNNPNKYLVYALNCMLKAGMLTINDCINADKLESTYHSLLHAYSLSHICTYLNLQGNTLLIPKSVYRYYKIFGKRLNRKYKKDQMPGGYISDLPKRFSEEKVAEAYTDAICKCIKLNTPIVADDIGKRKNSKAQFADIRQMRYNTDITYSYAYLHIHNEPAKRCDVYSNPWVFVKHRILQITGEVTSFEKQIYLRSEYSIENTVEENSILLLFVLYHECAHIYHWRSIERYDDIPSNEAHAVKRGGATYEHQADKFAVWNLIMQGIPIEMISSTLSNWCNNRYTRIRYTLNYSKQVLLRYCRWLSYLNNKYGKLRIPADLGYISVNRETGKLYKPNDEIKCIN